MSSQSSADHPSEEDPRNRSVLAYLSIKCTHSDVASDLMKSVEPLGDVQVGCPDWSQYRYVTVSTAGLIFGFAEGMQIIGFRVGSLYDRAIATGAEPFAELGDGWAKFTLHRSDWPKVDLNFWARKAYLFSRELALGSS